MPEKTSPDGPFRIDVAGDMTIEWDVPITVDDGNVLRADVFRPTAEGDYPSSPRWTCSFSVTRS
jgi:predicted acyl esterase